MPDVARPTNTGLTTLTLMPSTVPQMPRQRHCQDVPTIMPLSDVKARLSEIADEVDRTHERVHITRNGREYVVLISAEDLESIEATLELLSDPRAMAEIRESDAAVAAGDVTSGAEMAALMEERRRRERRGA
jgi:antitoxin YefM